MRPWRVGSVKVPGYLAERGFSSLHLLVGKISLVATKILLEMNINEAVVSFTLQRRETQYGKSVHKICRKRNTENTYC